MSDYTLVSGDVMKNKFTCTCTLYLTPGDTANVDTIVVLKQWKDLNATHTNLWYEKKEGTRMYIVCVLTVTLSYTANVGQSLIVTTNNRILQHLILPLNIIITGSWHSKQLNGNDHQ